NSCRLNAEISSPSSFKVVLTVNRKDHTSVRGYEVATCTYTKCEVKYKVSALNHITVHYCCDH
ncbi:hypothetical protein TorRG33x02_254500, partial [Trema orientale]